MQGHICSDASSGNMSHASPKNKKNGKRQLHEGQSTSSSDEEDLRKEGHQQKRRIKTTREKEKSNPQPENSACCKGLSESQPSTVGNHRLYNTKPTDSTASQSFQSSIIEVLDNNTQERLDHPLSLNESALGSVIHPKQICAVLDRKITESLVLLRDTIIYMQDRGLDTCLISLDQEKAFNKMPHMYILVSICDRFELAFGAKVNRGKSEAVLFGNWADQSFIPFTTRADYLKVLSI
eukprot:g33872.t1